MEEMNENGEVPGVSNEWACHEFGKPGHNYYTCPECLSRFQTYMAAKASIRALAAA